MKFYLINHLAIFSIHIISANTYTKKQAQKSPEHTGLWRSGLF